MNRSIMLAGVMFCALPWLSACGNQDKADSTTGETRSSISEALVEVREEVRKEVREGDITLNSDDKNAPKAKITSKGDLLIDGKPVAIDDEQRALLLQYREHVANVAEAGAEVGLHAAEIATDALGEALKGIFSGRGTDDVEKRIEAEARARIEEPVRRLCSHLPALMETEQALVAALPEFKPYADMDQRDIDDCLDEATGDAMTGSERAQMQQDIRNGIRNGVRDGVRSGVRGAVATVGDSANEAEPNAAEEAETESGRQ